MIKNITRRIAMLAGFARVTKLNDGDTVQKVQIQTPLDTRDDTLRFAEFGFSSGLPSGTDVITLSLGGDRSVQVAVASNHNGFRHSNLQPGEVVIYNQWGLYIKLKQDEIEIEAKGQKVNINNASDVTINCQTATVKAQEVTLDAPETSVTGSLKVSGITTTNGLVAGGDGDGVCTFRGNIDHIGDYKQSGDYEHTDGKITSLGRRVDGEHVHNYSSGGGTTERPNA